MSFAVLQSGDGYPVLLAEGEIISGDAAKLFNALRQTPIDNWGTRTLMLNSPGGDVKEALLMVSVMDQFSVTTVVPNGAKCASSCAQILFISGLYNIMVPGGLLGIHTCYYKHNISPSPLCNNEISENAVRHKIPFGSVMAFMENVKPNEMAWFTDKEADCWTLTKWPSGIYQKARGRPDSFRYKCINDLVNELKK